ncbi:hypothetical protein SAMN05216357_11054 [Porphyromonadaceae bacterium KH3CP3RA]|nr:hypothetical protein SAMN05216357_11054 [Porphyromonadaceae bacterium KH3CP3RA]
MKTETEQKFSWFPEDGNCPDVFDSIEDAVKDAQSKYDEKRDEFDKYSDNSEIINVGVVRFFDLKMAVKTFLYDLRDNIWDQHDDFAFGCDCDRECHISDKDKEIFTEEALNALYPLVEKYFFVNPEWVCAPTRRYDLKNKKWIEL